MNDLIKLAKKNNVSVHIEILFNSKMVCTSVINEKCAYSFNMTFKEIESAKFDVFTKKFAEAIKSLKEVMERNKLILV